MEREGIKNCWIKKERFSGTTIKDTWTKPRGRVEAVSYTHLTLPTIS